MFKMALRRRRDLEISESRVLHSFLCELWSCFDLYDDTIVTFSLCNKKGNFKPRNLNINV